MPGFNSNSNFRNNVKERFTSYDQLYAKLVELGSTSKRAFPLYTIGSDGNDSSIIGYWGYNSAGSIASLGDIRYSLVTNGGFGEVQSVDGAQTATLKSGHSLPSSFKAAVLHHSSSAEVFYNVQASVNGDALTLPSTTGMSAENRIYAIDRSEFTIGGATRNIMPQSGSIVFFNSGLYVKNGCCKATAKLSFEAWSIDARFAYSNSNPTDGSAAGIGIYCNNGTAYRAVGGGIVRKAGQLRIGSAGINDIAPSEIPSYSGVNQSVVNPAVIIGVTVAKACLPVYDGIISVTLKEGEAVYSVANYTESPLGGATARYLNPIGLWIGIKRAAAEDISILLRTCNLQ